MRYIVLDTNCLVQILPSCKIFQSIPLYSLGE